MNSKIMIFLKSFFLGRTYSTSVDIGESCKTVLWAYTTRNGVLHIYNEAIYEFPENLTMAEFTEIYQRPVNKSCEEAMETACKNLIVDKICEYRSKEIIDEQYI
jgi:hypothetical protein